jgi:GNAT superfamily N-acetyltransferase
MTYLHDSERWRSSYRFGAGHHSRDNFLPVLRSGHGNIIAFAWVDAAPAVDHGIAEPWWCINALAVDEAFEGKGHGRGLVNLIANQAADAGVVAVYGLSYPSAAGFWRAQGFGLTEIGGALASDRPARLLSGTEPRRIVLNGEPGHHMLFANLADSDPAAARLFPAVRRPLEEG